ncbi:MAG: TRAP transporter substrate-binding protein DctP [Mitsuaria chitosanitabida]|uniref:TRAP transporter substrate-binding protein n=1 Tax=Roseateles chitosanitabidus TaxID=65048 RepID=UPI001B0DED17|nr:TRAP transporter substrate-binding protein DctP [Roseateles chitosanitabidus]MBO9688569.1 TRAP transporter substrate-binding protein DctP [Roseateles chitosanitabidus]
MSTPDTTCLPSSPSRRRAMRAGLVAGGAAAVTVATGCASTRPPTASSAPLRWRMATSWPASLPLLNDCAQDFAHLVRDASGGRLSIELVDPARHGRPVGLLAAVRDGEFEMAHTTAQYYAAQLPAIDYFTAIPFGLTPVEQEGWLAEGGGQALFESLLAPLGVVPLTAGHTGIQMGGWFNRPIATAADLRGLRIRIAGFPGRVLARVGATPVNLPLGQIIPAFEDGRIDAADVVGPAVDATLPLSRHAPYYMAPWHEPDVALHLFIDAGRLASLPDDLRQIVRQAAQAAAMRSMARANDRNAVALAAMRARGQDITPWPAEVLAALRRATAEELAADAARHPDARRVIDSLLGYRARVQAYSLAADQAVFQARGAG